MVVCPGSACQERCIVYRASPAEPAGKGSSASFPSPAASPSQHSKKLTFCLGMEGKQMHRSILCHPFMALCPPIPLDAFQIALAFGLWEMSAKSELTCKLVFKIGLINYILSYLNGKCEEHQFSCNNVHGFIFSVQLILNLNKLFGRNQI